MTGEARARRLRWVVPPVLAGLLVAGAVVIPQAASASGRPSLKPITPAALVGRVLSVKVAHLSGTLSLTANLGLPDLSALTGEGSDPLAVLSGTHTAQLWYGASDKVRIAMPEGPGESDLIVNGDTAYIWQSSPFSVTKVVPPTGGVQSAHSTKVIAPAPPIVGIQNIHQRVAIGSGILTGGQTTSRAVPVTVPALCASVSAQSCRPLGFNQIQSVNRKLANIPTVPASCPASLQICGLVGAKQTQSVNRSVNNPLVSGGPVGPIPVPPGPGQVASQLLSSIGPTTAVTVTTTAYVAGRPVYELNVSPRNPQSLVGRIVIAVDSKTGLPLRVQVFARGATSVALSFGFTQISYAAPAASNFDFKPPKGAKIKTVSGGNALGALGGLGGLGLLAAPFLAVGGLGAGSSSVTAGPVTPLHGAAPTNSITCHGPGGSPAYSSTLTVPRKLVKVSATRGPLSSGPTPPLPRASSSAVTGPGGKAATPPGKIVSCITSVKGALTQCPKGCTSFDAGWVGYAPLGQSLFPSPRVAGSGWTSVVVIPGLDVSAGLAYLGFTSKGKQGASEVRSLLGSGTAVSGAWGKGRLVRTDLVDMLILSNHTVLVGAVTPAALEVVAALAG